jgi:hypothetical protein
VFRLVTSLPDVSSVWVMDGAAVMSNPLEVAPVSPLLLAARVYPGPTWLMLRSLNVATPFTAATEVVPESVPPPGLVPMAIPTVLVAVVSRAPN